MKPNQIRSGRGTREHIKKMAKSKRLVVGDLPREMIQINREGRKYRRTLEAEVIDSYGSINTTQAHHIDTATAATVQAGICRWLLRHKIEHMSTSDIRGCTADIVKAKNQRDAAVKQLKLDQPPRDPWELIDVQGDEAE